MSVANAQLEANELEHREQEGNARPSSPATSTGCETGATTREQGAQRTADPSTRDGIRADAADRALVEESTGVPGAESRGDLASEHTGSMEAGKPDSRKASHLAIQAAAARMSQALSGAAPAQRDRIAEEALLIAADPSSVPPEVVPGRQPSAEAKSSTRPARADLSLGVGAAPGGKYQEPPWAESFPVSDEVSLDVMKVGTIIENRAVAAEPSYLTFGRDPAASVALQHPSVSRLHAVLQFKGREAFLMDCSSVHGTVLNGRPLAAWRYHRVGVGAQLKFGHSTRTYIFNAPEEWQSPEGLNREGRAVARQQQEAAAAAKAEARAHAAAEAERAREALRGSVTWGMAPDAAPADGADEEDDEPDWRSRFEAGLLTQKQAKLAEQIRSREFKVERMQQDAQRIRQKEADQGELSSGQAAALLGAERGIDKIKEEATELEEALWESLRTSIAAKRAEAAAAADGSVSTGHGGAGEEAPRKGGLQKASRRRRRAGGGWSESDEEDGFFDRTVKQPRKGATGEQAVHTIVTLQARLQQLRTEEASLMKQLQGKEAAVPLSRRAAAADALDAFMAGSREELHGTEVQKLKHSLVLTQQQIEQTLTLLDVADGSGLRLRPTAARNTARGQEMSATPN